MVSDAADGAGIISLSNTNRGIVTMEHSAEKKKKKKIFTLTLPIVGRHIPAAMCLRKVNKQELESGLILLVQEKRTLICSTH